MVNRPVYIAASKEYLFIILFYAVINNISLAILSEIFIHIG